MTGNNQAEIKPPEFIDNISGEEYYEMIAKCAYYKAEKRGFESGYELDDWYSAKQEIDLQNFYRFQT